MAVPALKSNSARQSLPESGSGVGLGALFVASARPTVPWPIFVTPIYKSFMISKLAVRNLASGTTFGEFLR